MIFLFCLSVALLILSALIHLVTFFGVNIAGYFPAVWLLHLGIFVIAIPAVFMKPFIKNGRNQTGWHNLMQPIPKTYRQLLKWYPVYVAINFIVALFIS